jgi:hypothetical protein
MSLYRCCYGHPYSRALFAFLPASSFFATDGWPAAHLEVKVIPNVWVELPWAHLEAARRGIMLNVAAVPPLPKKPVAVPVTVLAEEKPLRRLHLDELFSPLKTHARTMLDAIKKVQVDLPTILAEPVFIQNVDADRGGILRVNGIEVRPDWAVHAVREAQILHSCILDNLGRGKYSPEMLKLVCYHPASDVAVLRLDGGEQEIGDGVVVKLEDKQVLAEVHVRSPDRTSQHLQRDWRRLEESVFSLRSEWFAVERSVRGDITTYFLP